jgi:4-hydroxy-3-polyprenylbenzoate decarboxylase
MSDIIYWCGTLLEKADEVASMIMTNPAVATTDTPTPSPELADLRGWLERVHQLGELHTIDAEVEPDEEMGGLTYLVGRQEGAPALLFNRVRGAAPGHRSLFNLLGTSLPRLALSLGLDPAMGAKEMVAATRAKVGRRLDPVTVQPASAPVNENVQVGADIDLYRFGPPKHWPRDGGPYIGTADLVMTRDPDLGFINAGTYRMMVHDRDHVGLYLSPGKDARLHITRAWQRGEDVPIAAVLGAHPLWMIVGSQTFPKNMSELEAIGGIAGAPLEVVQGQASGLPFPARAEIVIEGVIRANVTRQEGPFGEFTGYYGRPEAACPLVEVTAVHHRNQPILTNALMSDYPSCEMALFYAVTKSARIWDDLDKYGIPGVQGVWTVPAAASGFGMVVVSIEQRYAGHAAQVLALAAQAPSAAYYTKWIVAVDEDVDPTDINQVLWAMSTRCSPVSDIDVLRNTWSTWLDPTLNPPEERPWGSKALINACKDHRHLESFSSRTTLTRPMWERIAARWSEFGLPGQAPELLAYDSDAGAVRYHEASELGGGEAPTR